MKPSGGDTVLFADLASNVLAIAIVLLLVAAHLPGQTGTERDSPGRDLAGQPQSPDPSIRVAPPLGSSGNLRLLLDRRPAMPGLSIDLLRDGIRFGSLSGPVSAPAALPDALADVAAGEPIRLYVFSPAHYDDLSGRLRAAGRDDWREMSVPRALSQGDDWSDGMVRLAAGQPSPERFREGVLALLAAQAAPTGPAPARGGPTVAPRWAFDGPSLAERLRRWSGFVMLGFGAVMLAVMESRTRQRLRRRMV